MTDSGAWQAALKWIVSRLPGGKALLHNEYMEGFRSGYTNGEIPLLVKQSADFPIIRKRARATDRLGNTQ